MFFAFCFYLFFLLFYTCWPKFRVIWDWLWNFLSRLENFYKIILLHNFFNSFHKTLFFFKKKKMFDNFLLFFYEISFYWTVCLFSKNIIVCCDEDIGWWYLENFLENYSQYCHLLRMDSKNMFYFCLIFLFFYIHWPNFEIIWDWWWNFPFKVRKFL